VEGAAELEGSIANLASEYVLGLKATNCGTGSSLAKVEVTAAARTTSEKPLMRRNHPAQKARGIAQHHREIRYAG